MEKKSLRLKRAREPLISGVDDSEELSSKLQKLDERFDFNVTSDDLTHFMEGETPTNTKNRPCGLLKYVMIGERPRMQCDNRFVYRKYIYSRRQQYYLSVAL